MRYCPSCKINVEGSHKRCPICQNRLSGDASEDIYPPIGALKAGSLLYKIQLFIALSIMAVSLASEFLLGVTTTFHWSLLVCVWVIGSELWLRAVIYGHKNPGRVVSLNAWWLALLVMFTFLIIHDISTIYFWYIMPAIAIAAQVLLFIFMLVDRSHNCLAYFLGCSFLCVIMGILCMVITKQKTLLWVICLLAGVLGFLGSVVFKGRTVPDELEKRFHL